MKRSRREPTADELRLWARVTDGLRRKKRSTTPLADPPAAELGAAPPRPAKESLPKRPVQRVAPPPDRSAEKRVRRGKLKIGASLDLHGHTQATGKAAVLRFLGAARSRGDRVVLVVTGVGRAGEGVLRRRLPEWLGEPEVGAFVSGYSQAHRSHGGEGAYYVFLRAPFTGD